MLLLLLLLLLYQNSNQITVLIINTNLGNCSFIWLTGFDLLIFGHSCVLNVHYKYSYSLPLLLLWYFINTCKTGGSFFISNLCPRQWGSCSYGLREDYRPTCLKPPEPKLPIGKDHWKGQKSQGVRNWSFIRDRKQDAPKKTRNRKQ